jgi:hypothetical protein
MVNATTTLYPIRTIRNQSSLTVYSARIRFRFRHVIVPVFLHVTRAHLDHPYSDREKHETTPSPGSSTSDKMIRGR